MNSLGVFGMLAFLSLFHLIGGVVVGSAIRKLRQGFSIISIFLIIWGAGFSLAPIAMGLEIFQKAGMPYLVIVEFTVVLVTIVAAALLPREYLDEFKSKNVGMIATGGLFLLIGLGVGAILLRNGETVGWIILLLSGVAGGTVLLLGLRGLFKEK